MAVRRLQPVKTFRKLPIVSSEARCGKGTGQDTPSPDWVAIVERGRQASKTGLSGVSIVYAAKHPFIPFVCDRCAGGSAGIPCFGGAARHGARNILLFQRIRSPCDGRRNEAAIRRRSSHRVHDGGGDWAWRLPGTQSGGCELLSQGGYGSHGRDQ